MELARSVRAGLNLVTEQEVLSYSYTGPTPREVLPRIQLGTGEEPLGGNGGTYFLFFYINAVPVLPASVVTIQEDLLQAVMTGRPVAIDSGDVVTLSAKGVAGDTAVGTIATLRDATPVLVTDVFGAGSVLVDHDYGGVDNLAFKTDDGRGIDNAVVQCFLQSDWLNSRRGAQYILAATTTNSRGRWLQPMMLDPGTYTLVYFKQGSYGPNTRTLTVTE